MTILDDIRSRGYWHVLIRPEPYVAERVASLANLARIADEAQVRIRGWDYPHTQRIGLSRGQNWVGSEDVFGHHFDSWRLFQSGQFAHYRGMGDDWRDKSGLWAAPEGWRQGAGMGWGDAVYQFVEIYEYATRLALSEAGAERMVVRVDVVGLKGRSLVNDTRGWLLHEYAADIDAYTHDKSFMRDELIATPREHALDAALALFERFGWDTTKEILRGVLG